MMSIWDMKEVRKKQWNWNKKKSNQNESFDYNQLLQPREDDSWCCGECVGAGLS